MSTYASILVLPLSIILWRITQIALCIEALLLFIADGMDMLQFV